MKHAKEIHAESVLLLLYYGCTAALLLLYCGGAEMRFVLRIMHAEDIHAQARNVELNLQAAKTARKMDVDCKLDAKLRLSYACSNAVVKQQCSSSKANN